MVRLLKRGAIAGGLLIGAELAYAIFKPAPVLEQFDPSATFGDDDNPELKVAVLGDSSVTAPGVAGPEEIWVTDICARLAESGFFVVLQSFAVGGSRAQDLLATQVGPCLDFGPDLVLISVGGNDLIKGVTRRRFEADLDQLVDLLASDDVVVVQSGLGDLGTIPRLHPPLRNLVSRRSQRFDDIHWKVAGRHGTHVVHQRADSREAWLKNSDLWSEDQFHVSAAGHARWAETIWSTTIEPILPDLDGQR